MHKHSSGEAAPVEIEQHIDVYTQPHSISCPQPMPFVNDIQHNSTLAAHTDAEVEANVGQNYVYSLYKFFTLKELALRVILQISKHKM